MEQCSSSFLIRDHQAVYFRSKSGRFSGFVSLGYYSTETQRVYQMSIDTCYAIWASWNIVSRRICSASASHRWRHEINQWRERLWSCVKSYTEDTLNICSDYFWLLTVTWICCPILSFTIVNICESWSVTSQNHIMDVMENKLHVLLEFSWGIFLPKLIKIYKVTADTRKMQFFWETYPVEVKPNTHCFYSLA